jgi:hypothetical protein
MGKLVYDHDVRVEFEDRLLLHLQIVIGNKLRRGEGFFLSWRSDPGLGEGRNSIWLHPAASLTFKFSGSRSPSVNRDWVEALATTANSPRGLYAIHEPAPRATGAERGAAHLAESL